MKNTAQAPEADSKDSGILSNPLSFLKSGSFYWDFASLGLRGSYGLYWSLRSANTTVSNGLCFYNTGLDPQYANYYRGGGFAVRCVDIRPITIFEEHVSNPDTKA